MLHNPLNRCAFVPRAPSGDTPTEADASMFAVLDNIIHDLVPNKLKDIAKAKPNLVAFVDRIRMEYYAEPSKYPKLS